MSNSCACVYVDVDCDGPELYTVTKPRARKPHKCGECGREIKLSEKYENVVGLWGGRFNIHKTCSVCLDIRSVFFCEGWFFGEVLEYLEEHIREMHGHISEDCLAELTAEAREMVSEIIEEYWEEK